MRTRCCRGGESAPSDIVPEGGQFESCCREFELGQDGQRMQCQDWELEDAAAELNERNAVEAQRRRGRQTDAGLVALSLFGWEE